MDQRLISSIPDLPNLPLLESRATQGGSVDSSPYNYPYTAPALSGKIGRFGSSAPAVVFAEASDDGLSLAAVDGENSSLTLENHAARDLVCNIQGTTRLVSWRPDLLPALGRPAMFVE